MTSFVLKLREKGTESSKTYNSLIIVIPTDDPNCFSLFFPVISRFGLKDTHDYFFFYFE